MEFDRKDIKQHSSTELPNKSQVTAPEKIDILDGSVTKGVSSTEHVKRDAFKEIDTTAKESLPRIKSSSESYVKGSEDQAQSEALAKQKGFPAPPSVISRGLSIASSVLEEKDMLVLTSLESYYPERPKPNPKDKKTKAEFATNIDQPKEPKYIKVKASFDKTAHETSKELKGHLRLSSHRGALTSRGLGRTAYSQSGGGFFSARGNNDMRRVSAMQQPGQQMKQVEDAKNDELKLYLFNTRAKNKMMAFKRLENQEFPLRLLGKPRKKGDFVNITTAQKLVKAQSVGTDQNNGELTRESQYDYHYILCFVNMIQIQTYMLVNGCLGGGIGELTPHQQAMINNGQQHLTAGMHVLMNRAPIINAMSNLIPRALVSSAQWERKGKLKKKSSTTDVFKDRHFVLERDHLYYYKSERTKDKIFTCIILSNADIRMFSSDLHRGQQDPGTKPSYVKDKNYYILEIENESRKYVLSAKSHFDLEEWFNAIYAQIDSLNTNRILQKNTQNIIRKEQDIAQRDQQQVKNLTKLQMITSNQMQPRLLEFVNDVFITELLPNVTKYMLFAEKKERKRALDKATEIIEKQLKPLHSRSQALINNMGGQAQKKTKAGEESYKRYKTLPMQGKIACLITAEDLQSICKGLENMQKLPPDHEKMSANSLVEYQQKQIDPQLFQRTSTRIVRVLKYNYLPDFNRREIQLLTLQHSKGCKGLGFNSLQACKGVFSLPDKPQIAKQTNIFSFLGQQAKEPKQWSAAIQMTPLRPQRSNKTLTAVDTSFQDSNEEMKFPLSARVEHSNSLRVNVGQIKKVKEPLGKTQTQQSQPTSPLTPMAPEIGKSYQTRTGK